MASPCRADLHVFAVVAIVVDAGSAQEIVDANAGADVSVIVFFCIACWRVMLMLAIRLCWGLLLLLWLVVVAWICKIMGRTPFMIMQQFVGVTLRS